MTEAEIEKKVCDFAKKRGWWPIKMATTFVVGFPDRMFLGRGGNVFFIEFKAPNKTARPSQRAVMIKLARLGFVTYVVDNVEEGKQFVERKTAELPKAGS